MNSHLPFHSSGMLDYDFASAMSYYSLYTIYIVQERFVVFLDLTLSLN